MRTRTESLRQGESKRGKELELSEMQEMCLWNLGNRADEQVVVRHVDAPGGNIIERTNTKRTE